MAHCAKCSAAIIEEEQYYTAENIGPDIIACIEEDLGRDVDGDELICSACFESIVQRIMPAQPAASPPSQGENLELQHAHDVNVCVWCRYSLYGRSARSIQAGVERDFVAERIAPRQIPDGALLCVACWVHTRRTLQNQGILAPPPVNLNNCVWCERSLFQRRRVSLTEGPERNLIIARIYPREIPTGGRVCYACWVAARRAVQRAANEVQRHDVVCACCQASLYRRQTHLLRSGPVRDRIGARIYPRELPEHALVCNNCWNRAQEDVAIEQGEILRLEPPVADSTMSLDGFRHTTNSSNSCFVPDCGNPERNVVPNYLKKRILKSRSIFVTDNARVCNIHRSIYNWEFLDEHEFSNSFTKNEIESMLRLVTEEEDILPMDFEHFENIDENAFKYWTGQTKEVFSQIYNLVSAELTSKTPKLALGLYLMKVRTGDSHDRISSLFCLSKASVSRLIQDAREALNNIFVPLYLGVERMTRQELITRNRIIPEGLFGNTEERVPIVICDGTYIYLQKSSNYLFQKKTYSLHKYRNLVKPFLIVTPDGFIVDVFGPYPATESDSDIMKALFQNENSSIRNLFQRDDVFILDRGFRDAVPYLESLGYKVHKPESLEQGEFQLPTIRANQSRCVTLCRWVVEVVNGRFKRDFKLLRQEYFNLAATHLMDDVRICAALINAFHPVIEDRPDAEIILNRALNRLHMPNLLAQLVISNRINRYRANFTNIDGQLPELQIFPVMTMSDLILFALGTYQIKQARSYYGEHLREHGSFRIEVSDEVEVVAQAIPSQPDPLLIRGRIKSRHHSGRIYYTYILLAREGSDWDERIISYYCNCIAGQRTVGCCAHVMTIIWYLRWARFQENITAPASFLDGILVREDIENED